MKRKYLALTVLSFMVCSYVAPFVGYGTEQTKTDVAAQEETTIITNETPEIQITKEVPTVTKDVPKIKLMSGISSVIFDDNLLCKKIVQDDYISYRIPYNKGFKSYMSYKAITHKSSKQYKIQNKYAYTGTYGIRQVNDRYCVAVGTYFQMEVGTYFDLVLENGTVIQCILSDVKDNKHTLSDNITTASNGCVSEFITDIRCLPYDVRNNKGTGTGDISDCCEEWDSPVKEIRVYDKNILNKE